MICSSGSRSLNLLTADPLKRVAGCNPLPSYCHTHVAFTQRNMIRQRLSQLLAAAAVKVAQDQTPERIKAQLKVRRDALTHEVNDYRNALSNFIAAK